MRTITGTRHKTIILTANEITKFNYSNPVALDIYNASDKDIWISADNNITATIDSEDCLLLPADGGAYNGLRTMSFTCVSADAATIVVVQRGW